MGKRRTCLWFYSTGTLARESYRRSITTTTTHMPLKYLQTLPHRASPICLLSEKIPNSFVFHFQMVLGQSDFVIEDVIQLSLPDYPKMTTTHSFCQNNMNFLVQQPRELLPEYSIAFVLDIATWIAFFASWLIVILIHGIISKMNVRNQLFLIKSKLKKITVLSFCP